MAGQLNNAQLVSEVEELKFLAGQNLDNKDIGQCWAVQVKIYSCLYFVLASSAPALVQGATAKAFNYATGGQITPGASGGTATAFQATAAETNWPGQNNMLPKNQMIVGLAMGTEMFLADLPGATTPCAVLGAIPTNAAAEQIARSVTYVINEGDTIAQNYGLLLDWPSGVGVSTGASAYGQGSAAAARFDLGVQNGGPASRMQPLVVPFIQKPQIAYDHTFTIAKGATLIDGVAAAANINGNILANHCVGIRVSYLAYKITAQT
jgi:hypothetical protein